MAIGLSQALYYFLPKSEHKERQVVLETLFLLSVTGGLFALFLGLSTMTNVMTSFDVFLTANGLLMLAVGSVVGLGNSVLTRDQVKLLEIDNVVSDGAKGFADLGMSPTPVESMVGEYLYAYRPYGQYDAITESAANLKA